MTPIEEIKAKLDLVDFLRAYMELKPAGKNWKASCPFHREKSASFMVSPDRGIWHCFGCGEGGDIFKFVMKYENLEFYEALKLLAEKANVELKKISPQDHKEFDVLFEINRAAVDFYKSELKKYPVPQTYLSGRGLAEETIVKFEIGFAPNSWEDLTLHLLRLGYDAEDIIRSGLSLKTEKGKIIDRFRGRIMFPLENTFGKPMGFTGRILPEFDDGKQAKYLNSPETPIFSKSRLIFGLSKAKDAIREKKEILLVEGQMDVIMSHQDGVGFAVGTSGTALTEEQLITMKRYSDKLILNFDNDEAGKMAAERSIDLALAKDFTVKILDFSAFKDEIGDLKDPADIVKAFPGKLKEIVDRSVYAFEWYFSRYPVSVSDIVEKKKNIRFILRKIGGLNSAIDKSYWIKELSFRSSVKESDLMMEMSAFNSNTNIARREEGLVMKAVKVSKNLRKTKRDSISERLILLSLLSDEIKAQLEPASGYLSPADAIIWNAVKNGNNDQSLRENIDELTFRASALPTEGIGKEAEILIIDLEIEYLLEERNKLLGGFSDDGEVFSRHKELTGRIEELKKRKFNAQNS